MKIAGSLARPRGSVRRRPPGRRVQQHGEPKTGEQHQRLGQPPPTRPRKSRMGLRLVQRRLCAVPVTCPSTRPPPGIDIGVKATTTDLLVRGAATSDRGPVPCVRRRYCWGGRGRRRCGRRGRCRAGGAGGVDTVAPAAWQAQPAGHRGCGGRASGQRPTLAAHARPSATSRPATTAVVLSRRRARPGRASPGLRSPRPLPGDVVDELPENALAIAFDLTATGGRSAGTLVPSRPTRTCSRGSRT